jgi:hypothetical protein
MNNINQSPGVAKANEPCATETIITRIQTLNSDLCAIDQLLREFEERIQGDPSKVPHGSDSERITPPPVFLPIIHHSLDDSFNYIASIRDTINKLQRF